MPRKGRKPPGHEPSEKSEFQNPPGKPGPCVNCGQDIGDHRQDILEDPSRFACPIVGIDWGSIYDRNQT